ncbi:hypothetical protein PybrP1_003643 [[Pythium] brassicae (nom. inval.)]|nr:hypothetical protein PybrP1_003643 [[Pythium] brassicae (nom. inval.)]
MNINAAAAFFLEEQATLAETLAFIDMFPSVAGDDDTDLTDHSATSDSGAHDVKTAAAAHRAGVSCRPTGCGSASGTESSSGDNDEEHQRKLRARAANTRAVHRYRKRNKNEIIYLRGQVQQLEVQLAGLRGRSRDATSVQSAPRRASCSTASASELLQLQASSAGAGDAVAKYRKRQQSEALNQRLKLALEKQRTISAALEDDFRKQLATTVDLRCGVDVEQRVASPTLRDEVFAGRDNAPLLSYLFRHVQDQVYASTATALQVFARSDVDSVFSMTTNKYDAATGRTFEFASNTPLEPSVERVDAKLWSFFTSTAGPVANVVIAQRHFSLTFDGLVGNTLVDGVSVIRKFVEPHRIVITYSSLLTPSGSGLLFRENSWHVISDARVSGCTAAPTLLQTVYQLRMDRADAQAPLSPEHAMVHDMVLNKQGDNLRSYLMRVQDRLLRGFDASVDSTFVEPH